MPSPNDAFIGGLQVGNAVQVMEAKRQQQEQAQQAQMQRQQVLSSLLNNPNPTATDYANASVMVPELREHFDQAWKMRSADQQAGELSRDSQVYSALISNRPDVAAQQARTFAESLRNSGDEGRAKLTETFAQMIEADPALARMKLGLKIAAAGDKGKTILDSATAMQEAPAKLRKAEAEATTSEAKAKYADQAESAGARKLAADATSSEAEASVAGEKATLNIKKLKAEIGLTSAQAATAVELAKKYRQETAIAVATAATGDPAKKFDAESKLRNEFTRNIAGAMDTRESYRRVLASKPDAVGDLSLIYGYMKMLDPASVVREGEFASAQNAAGVPTRVQNLYNKVLNGERLSDSQRKQFLSQAKDLNDVAERRIGEERDKLKPVISAYKLDDRNIFGEPPAATVPPPKPAALAVGAIEDGYRYKGGDPAKPSSWERVK